MRRQLGGPAARPQTRARIAAAVAGVRTFAPGPRFGVSRTRRPALPARTMAAAGSADDAIRAILTSLHVPLACEEKACRRSLRCVGKHRPDEQVLTVPCYDRHRATLQPFFCAHVLRVLKAGSSETELEDKF